MRVDTSLIPGSLVVGSRGLGVLGSSVPSAGGSGSGYLYNDLALPADAGKEVRGLILTPPSSGLLHAYEDSSFDFSGAADGIYTFTYRLFVDGADTGVGTATLQVGSPVAAIVATTSTPVFTGSSSVDGAPAESAIAATTGTPVFSGSSAGVTSTIARPTSDVSNTGWSPSAGSDLFAMLDEVSPDDADYISTSTLGAVCKMALNATQYPGSAAQQLSLRASSATGNGLSVTIKDGATTIATRSLTLTPIYDLHTITLTSGEIAAITSGNLTVEMTST